MTSIVKVGADVEMSAAAVSGAKNHPSIAVSNHYRLECFDADGNLKWVEEFQNIVPDGGLDDVLDKYLKGSGYTASFYIGLTDSAPETEPSDTMVSHDGWTEIVAYEETEREALTLGAVSGQAVDNASNKAVFTFNADAQSIGGAFITTDATKGGTAGTLYSVAAFNAGDKVLDTNDTLNVTATCTAAAV